MSFEMIRRLEFLRKKERRIHSSGYGGRFLVCMVYPNVYHVGMSNLGFQSIYREIASTPDFFGDRAFLPDPDILPLYQKSKRTLMSLEMEKPLQEFSIIAFSISYELDFLNVLRILNLSGIPLLSRDRDSSWPLIIAGGAAVSINPETIADFIDIFFIGEGERSLAEFLESYRENGHVPREELLRRAAEIEGVYVPSLYKITYTGEGYIEKVEHDPGLRFPVQRQVVEYLEEYTHSVIVTSETEFSDTFLMEVSRGCPFSCGFCCVSLHHKPFRWMSVDCARDTVRRGLACTGKIGLLGAAVGSYPYLEEILDEVEKLGGEVGFASLRADVLKFEILRKLRRLGQNLVTLAPETGRDELRSLINKTLTTEKLYRVFEAATEAGFRDFRLYFMVGIPGETDEDIYAAVDMIRYVYERVRPRGGRIFVSVNQFVPKPGTRLELSAFEEEETVLSRIHKMETPFYGNPGVEFKIESIREMQLQAFLGRGCREWSSYLLDWYFRGISQVANRFLRQRKRDASIESLVFRSIPSGVVPPWRVIE